MGNLDFGLLNTTGTLSTPAYEDGSGGGKAENVDFVTQVNTAGWHEILTVPTGKTYFLTDVIAVVTAATVIGLATGAAASEVQFMAFGAGDKISVHIHLVTPIKFQSGTRISGSGVAAGTIYYSLVGREE